MLSRSADKLNATKEDIEKTFPQCKEIQTLTVDFSKDDIYDQIQQKLEKLRSIEVLVNNVGLSYPYAEYFTLVSQKLEFLMFELYHFTHVHLSFKCQYCQLFLRNQSNFVIFYFNLMLFAKF